MTEKTGLYYRKIYVLPFMTVSGLYYRKYLNLSVYDTDWTVLRVRFRSCAL
jgi:hypothetical protein